MMSPLSARRDLCLYNQMGFCKFGAKCLQIHENEICKNRSECTNNNCRNRHPRSCRYYCQFGHCKFGQGCAYSHVMESKNKSHKEETLEKEVAEMKIEMMKLKVELSEKLEEEVVELKKNVTELTESVKFLKRVMGKMVNSIKSLEGEVVTEVRGKETKEDERDKRQKEKAAEVEDKEAKKEEQKFKCEMCDYGTKRKITLKKHVNTKHNGNDEKNEENGEVRSKRNTEDGVATDISENCDSCENCKSCDNCDFFKNCEKCEKCKILLFAWAAEQCGVEWSG